MGSAIAVPIAVGLSLLSSKPSDIITFFKWLYAYCYIAAFRHFTKKRFDNYDIEAFHDPVKAIFLPPQVEIDTESPQPESHLQQASDKIFFYGVNSSSERLVVWIARSLNEEAEAFLHLRLADGKVYRLCQTSGYQDSSSDAEREFTCGRLRVHYNSPMRRWRIFYNGLLRETTEQDSNTERTVYVKLALLYKASSDLFDATCDINSAALALGLAKASWKSLKPPLEKINRSLDMYNQAGSIFGTVSIDGESAERHLYLFGERMRYLGDANFKPGAQFTHILGHISKNGSIFHLIEGTIPGIAKELRFGFVVHPTGDLAPISNVDPQFRFSEDGEAVIVDIDAEGMEFRVRGRVAGNLCHFESGKGFEGSLNIDCLDVRMNGNQGRGFLYKEKVLKLSAGRTDKVTTLKGTPKEVPFAVQFSEDKCELSDITGGKGSSLGKLTGLSKKFKTFIVPNGIVVTTSAYEAFVNKDIVKEIRHLEAITYKKKSGDVKEACQRVMDEIVKANITDSVYQAIVKCLNKTFGELTLTKKFAVRSSATGEDTEQMSAAGQMETFLGIKGTNEIILAVKKCWASQFSFTAVQYKRQYGQVLNSPMAVVIQEMIPCDVAGVLFTCDPLNGNPAVMSITANYGLGESVVSASEEPDTLVLRRDEDDKLEIKDKIIGAKSHRIVVGGDEGTRVEDVNEAEKGSCCLSDALALRLGNIAVQIEKSYRSSRDIEWGFWNNNLYLFQSRPVTSGCGETDYEIDHEIDFPKRIENEYFSVCNIGEVMPGAMSPLGYDIVYKFFFVGHWKKSDVNFLSKPPMYFYKTFGCVLSHAIFSITDFMDLIREGQAAVDSVFFSFFGRLLDDKELYEAAYNRHGWVMKKKPLIDLGILKEAGFFFNVGRVLKRGRKLFANYHVPVERMTNSRDVFDTLMLACTDLSEALHCNTFALYSSGRWNYFIMKLLAKARGGYTQEVYQDFSKLLTSISGVESADVPSAMQNLAQCIGKEMNPEDFKKKDSEEIHQWLKTSPTAAGKKFREFLVTHGHRCLKEFDIRSATWSENPELLIGILKNLVGNLSESSSSKTHQNINNLVDSLGENLTFFERLLLKYFLLPGSRKTVSVREASKSLLIKQVDAWRKAYKYLARLMVSEGRIPDEDLMFFMNLEEIKELLSTRSPRIISKATHRRRRYAILDEYIFPEISIGIPKPINADDTPIVPTEDDFKMQGIPVSQGVAKGFVRVALTLEEASHLKRGEILLTYCTDIGWTPYFPSLAGVVTELGGLISHGAVVSREYGLPCIAGLHGATRRFQTGDYVLLDGNKGILQKISPP